MSSPSPERTALDVLLHYNLAPSANAGGSGAAPALHAVHSGLINHTYEVECGSQRYVIQRLNPIFSVQIHANIDTVSRHLADRGLCTPRLLRTREGGFEVENNGVWRLLSYVGGETRDALSGPAMVHSAAAWLGQWHRACADLDHHFVQPRRSHDTPAHLENLRVTLRACQTHPHFSEVATLAAAILAAAHALETLPTVQRPVIHGDPKVSNFRFVGETAIALIDLDTVGPGQLGHELGDAWRSWCNPHAEDDPESELSLDFHAAAVAGYLEGWAAALDAPATRAALLGVEWIALELSARFANDALRECYFSWDPRRFERAATHNLARARAQFNLFRSARAQRAQRLAALTTFGCP